MTKNLPNFWISIIPIAAILICFNGIHLAVETSVFIGVALATILMWNRVKGINGWIAVFNEGAANSGVSILNTAIVVGFGGVVKNTQGFADLVELLKTFNMPALIFVMVTVAICAGACGSASRWYGCCIQRINRYIPQPGRTPGRRSSYRCYRCRYSGQLTTSGCSDCSVRYL